MDLLVSLAAVAAGVLTAGAISDVIARRLFRVLDRLLGRQVFERASTFPETSAPAVRIADASKSVLAASRVIDQAIAELASDIQKRQDTLAELESLVDTLEGREQAARERIDALESITPAAAVALAAEMSRGERRAVRRDIVLLMLGLVLALPVVDINTNHGFVWAVVAAVVGTVAILALLSVLEYLIPRLPRITGAGTRKTD